MSYGNVFDAKNKKSSMGNIWKPDVVGAECAGVLVDRENYEGDYKGTKTLQRKYTLVDEAGEQITVFGRYGKPGSYKSFPEFDKAPLGSIVGVKYMGDKVPKSGGLPYKVIDVFVSDETKPEVLTAHEFNGKIVQNVDEIPF